MRKVLSVKLLPDYELELRFDTQEVKVFDTKPYLDRGVFAELKDPEYFSRVAVFLDSIAWPHGQDFDPGHLYEEGRAVSRVQSESRGAGRVSPARAEPDVPAGRG